MQAHLTSLQWCHVQLEKLARSRIQAWQVEQTKIVSELLMAADALVVIDKITAAVQDQLALVDLQGSWMMRGVPMHKIDSAVDEAVGKAHLVHIDPVAPVRAPVSRDNRQVAGLSYVSYVAAQIIGSGLGESGDEANAG